MLAIEGRKGLPPIEGFFLARQFMYQQVYHHKATRAAESLIRAIFIRVAEIVREGSTQLQIPIALRQAAVGEPVDARRLSRARRHAAAELLHAPGRRAATRSSRS